MKAKKGRLRAETGKRLSLFDEVEKRSSGRGTQNLLIDQDHAAIL